MGLSSSMLSSSGGRADARTEPRRGVKTNPSGVTPDGRGPIPQPVCPAWSSVPFSVAAKPLGPHGRRQPQARGQSWMLCWMVAVPDAAALGRVAEARHPRRRWCAARSADHR